MEKINILVCPSDRFGVFYHRSKNPHESLGELYSNDFNIEFNHEPNWSDLSSFEKYHIIHIHKGLYQDMEMFWSALKYFKTKNIVTILDIDVLFFGILHSNGNIFPFLLCF